MFFSIRSISLHVPHKLDLAMKTKLQTAKTELLEFQQRLNQLQTPTPLATTDGTAIQIIESARNYREREAARIQELKLLEQTLPLIEASVKEQEAKFQELELVAQQGFELMERKAAEANELLQKAAEALEELGAYTREFREAFQVTWDQPPQVENYCYSRDKMLYVVQRAKNFYVVERRDRSRFEG
jgi:hypothetical protein